METTSDNITDKSKKRERKKTILLSMPRKVNKKKIKEGLRDGIESRNENK
jgi:hypothetical protein